MLVNFYYWDEFGYLKELGVEFVKVNLCLFKYLVDDLFDLDVECLMEGFVFLVGCLC